MQRTFGKVVNFLHNYGGGPLAVHENFKTMGIRVPVEFCQELLHAVDKTYPNLAKYSKEIAAYAQDRGYVDTIYGYKRLLPFINSSNHKMRSGSERQASNSPIQGSAADIMKRCQNDIYDELAKKVFPYNDVKMCAQVHDEIIFELPDNMEQLIAFDKAVKAIMEREPIPNFPIDIVAESSTGYKWGEKKDFKY